MVSIGLVHVRCDPGLQIGSPPLSQKNSSSKESWPHGTEDNKRVPVAIKNVLFVLTYISLKIIKMCLCLQKKGTHLKKCYDYRKRGDYKCLKVNIKNIISSNSMKFI